MWPLHWRYRGSRAAGGGDTVDRGAADVPRVENHTDSARGFTHHRCPQSAQRRRRVAAAIVLERGDYSGSSLWA